MSHDLPDDWYEDHDGQRSVLNSEKVAAEVERLRRRVTVLEMVISQECDGDFCRDDLNRMIVDDIRGRSQSPVPGQAVPKPLDR